MVQFYFICDVIADNITLDSCEISHKYLSFSSDTEYGVYMAILWFQILFQIVEIRIKEKQYFSERKKKSMKNQLRGK